MINNSNIVFRDKLVWKSGYFYLSPEIVLLSVALIAQMVRYTVVKFKRFFRFIIRHF